MIDSTSSKMEDKILSVAVVEDRNSRNRSMYIEDVYEIVEKIFKIHPTTELGVLQKRGGQSKDWQIAVKNEDLHIRKNMEKFVGEIYRLSSGCVVNVNRTYEIFTHIVVKDVPPFWTDETVERVFQVYGRVQSVTQEAFKYSV